MYVEGGIGNQILKVLVGRDDERDVLDLSHAGRVRSVGERLWRQEERSTWSV
jgi:hypothetical protein